MLPNSFNSITHRSIRQIRVVIVVIALSDFPLYIGNLYGLWCEKLFCLIQDVQATILFVGMLALFVLIRSSLGFGTPFQIFI